MRVMGYTIPINKFLFHRCTIRRLTSTSRDDYGKPITQAEDREVKCFVDIPKSDKASSISSNSENWDCRLFLCPEEDVKQDDEVLNISHMTDEQFSIVKIATALNERGVHHLELLLVKK